jgi:hypothetical protein
MASLAQEWWEAFLQSLETTASHSPANIATKKFEN